MSFENLNLIKPLLRAIREQGYETPSPIQEKAIPFILKGVDLLASAQTGTGKTAAFTLPILQKLTEKPQAKAKQAQALILTPTRELAIQIHTNVVQYSQHLKLRSAVVYGGVKINAQIAALQEGVEILVATPGRLLDLHQQNAIHFTDIQTLVLDEADRMLDMGFIHDIKRIIALLPRVRQNLLFSATFSDDIRKLAKKLLVNPVEVSVATRNATAVKVNQIIFPVDKARKTALLCHLIHKENWQQALVFSRTKHGANKLVKGLTSANVPALAIHGNKSQPQRIKALNDFKNGKVQILVATDIAARGIDIEQLPLVVNFDLPDVPHDYVHRIGRTGRAGHQGLAVSLVCADEFKQLQAIEKVINHRLKRIEVDDFEPNHRLPTQAPKASAVKARKAHEHSKMERKNKGRYPFK
ncbi:ATP-dependent RNA helicase RhlE [Legionella beliardensis]|uniref:DEAD-box ATP-dependent RNA helicase RhpA n=1 Tax=Legionella beliardensis TaxID=91822 RepID=A0A378I229_9GAMM|nr:DEAD/DEAH box helicase [Legionella beliardensis]STX28735.1 ATP-dependent RNA helicase RhlE [Legionella beliardensis]